MYVCMHIHTVHTHTHTPSYSIPSTVALTTFTSMVCPFAGEETTADTNTYTHKTTYIHTYIHVHTYIGNTCSLYIPKPTMEIDAPAPPDSETSYCLKTLYQYPCMYVMYVCMYVCMYVLACCSYLGSCSGRYVEHKLHALDRGTIR